MASPTGVRTAAVVTGIGAVSAFGWGIEALHAGLRAGATSIRPITRFDASAFPTAIAAQVPEPDRARTRGIEGWARMSLADRFAVSAAREAVARAGLPGDLSSRMAGVFFASSTGGMLESEIYYAWGRHDGIDRGPRHLLVSQQVNRPGEAVARDLSATGPVESVSSACASAALAIGLALEAVRDGEVEIALAGGADSLCRVTYAGFNALQAVDSRPCRPFRADRAGLSLGEGAAVLVIERPERAAARGARPLAVLLGAGASADAHHMTAPDPSGGGAARALALALDDAGCRPDEVGLVNAHGTGTPLNDVAEYRALVRVFGDGARSIPVLATKASVGHLLGCAGAIEAVATILALGDQRLQPVPGGGDSDPATPVRLAREATAVDCRIAVSLNLGFGGCNGALVLGRAGAEAGAERVLEERQR